MFLAVIVSAYIRFAFASTLPMTIKPSRTAAENQPVNDSTTSHGGMNPAIKSSGFQSSGPGA